MKISFLSIPEEHQEIKRMQFPGISSSIFYKHCCFILGCVESLRTLLYDDDSTVRHKATEVLHIAASHNVGRNALREFNVIIPLSVVSILGGCALILIALVYMKTIQCWK